MIYDPGGEVILTAYEAVIMRRLLGVLDIGKVEKLIAALEEVKDCNFARVTIIQRNGLARFVEVTKTVE